MSCQVARDVQLFRYWSSEPPPSSASVCGRSANGAADASCMASCIASSMASYNDVAVDVSVVVVVDVAGGAVAGSARNDHMLAWAAATWRSISATASRRGGVANCATSRGLGRGAASSNGERPKVERHLLSRSSLPSAAECATRPAMTPDHSRSPSSLARWVLKSPLSHIAATTGTSCLRTFRIVSAPATHPPPPLLPQLPQGLMPFMAG
eukprot:1177721-Prorocentrum_minimum.AAC.1